MSGTSSQPHAAGGAERRRQERRECISTGVLNTGEDSASCTVVNISEGGGAIIVNAASPLAIGRKVVIATPEIGEIETVVRWAAHPRYGLQLAQSEAPQQYRNFFASLSTERILASRTEFFNLGSDAQQRVAALAPLIAREMPPALDKLYHRINQTKGMRELFESPAAMECARAKQMKHWRDLSSGVLTPAYLDSVRRVGETHARIGLEPHWYIGGYAMVLEHLIESVVAARAPRAFSRRAAALESVELGRSLSALAKMVLMDVGSAVSAYLDAANEARLAGEAETITQERTLVADSIGEGLVELARRNLGYRMNGRLPDVYRRLQTNYNSALDQLDAAMGSAKEIVAAVNSGVGEIANAADDLSARTERQAASLQETASALNEITGAAAATAASVAQAQQGVATANKAVEQSADIVSRAVEAMQKIAGSSRKIVHFIGVIDEIAFQTNLLALNAGVEAARAGDAGRGFSVVAAEVRALALRAAEAAKEIKALLSDSSRHVDEGVSLVDATGATLTQISGQVTAINAAMGEVSTSAAAQANGLREINSAIADMDQVTQQNAAMAEQSTAACRAALSETERLAELVATFKLSQAGAGGSGQRLVAPPRRAA